MASPTLYAWHVVACLIADPSSCTEYKISIPGTNELNCHYLSVPMTVEWLKEQVADPEKLRIGRIDCRDRIAHPRKTADATTTTE